MKNTQTPLIIMKNMVDKLQLLYQTHNEKSIGIIQFNLTHEKQQIDCYVTVDRENLMFFEGNTFNPTVIVKSTFYNWLALAGGKLNPIWGVLTGKLKFKGDTSFFKVLPRKAFVHVDIPKDPVTKFEQNPVKYWKSPSKVIVLAASPRGQNGYTDFFLKPFIKGMSKNAEVEIHNLNEFSINPCTGCFACWMKTPGKCIYHSTDDFNQLAEIMYTADITVYAFPIYADGMPGILKNYFDRSVSRAYPYMIEGMNRVRHPRRYIHENHSMVVFSICGFFEMINFEPVRAYFKALAHNRHTPVVAEIYRTTAVGLYGNPFAFKMLNKILDALEKAGEEIVLKGKIKRSTQKIIHQKFNSSKYDIQKVNEWWKEKEACQVLDY